MTDAFNPENGRVTCVSRGGSSLLDTSLCSHGMSKGTIRPKVSRSLELERIIPSKQMKKPARYGTTGIRPGVMGKSRLAPPQKLMRSPSGMPDLPGLANHVFFNLT